MRCFSRDLFLTILLPLVGSLSVAGSADPNLGRQFKSEEQSALQVVRSAVKNSRVMILALTSHRTFSHYELLEQVLREEETVSDLRAIAFERPSEMGTLYSQLLANISPSFRQDQSQELQELMLYCGGPDVSYEIRHFHPLLRMLNHHRAPAAAIRLTSFDGLPLSTNLVLQQRLKDHRPYDVDLDCAGASTEAAASIKEEGAFAAPLLSEDREERTAANFERQVWGLLQGKGKAIVVNHLAHVIKGYESCQFSKETEEKWMAKWSTSGWLERFFVKHPEARGLISTVVLDRRDRDNPGGALRLSTQLRPLAEPGGWGIDLKPFLPLLNANELFNEMSFFGDYLAGFHRPMKNGRLFADALIWNDSAPDEKKFGKMEDYLPAQCKDAAIRFLRLLK